MDHDLTDSELDELWDEFHTVVNMTSRELGDWLRVRAADEVGEALPDQTGTVRTLQSLMKPKGLMLLFYRSADWCPYCKTQLADLQARLPQLTKQGLGVAAVSYDPVPILADASQRTAIRMVKPPVRPRKRFVGSECRPRPRPPLRQPACVRCNGRY